MQSALLDVTGVTKSFAGVQALRGVDLDVAAGRSALHPRPERRRQVDADQGARGRPPPDEGEISWQGERVEIPTPEAAIELGIATMYQELDVVDGLTIAENIFLGHELARGGFTAALEAARRPASCSAGSATATSHRNPRSASCSAANKQIVSMARALSHDIKLIIMDEPIGRARRRRGEEPLPRRAAS